MRVVETFTPETKRWEGRTIGEIAQRDGPGRRSTRCSTSRSPTSCAPRSCRRPRGDDAEDWQARARVWRDDRTVIGASDAGAHLDMIDTFAVPTQVLGNGVRRHGVIALEEAVHQLTDVPARLYGLRERGRLAQGWRADVVGLRPGGDRAAGRPTRASTCRPAQGACTPTPTASSTCS